MDTVLCHWLMNECGATPLVPSFLHLRIPVCHCVARVCVSLYAVFFWGGDVAQHIYEQEQIDDAPMLVLKERRMASCNDVKESVEEFIFVPLAECVGFGQGQSMKSVRHVALNFFRWQKFTGFRTADRSLALPGSRIC